MLVYFIRHGQTDWNVQRRFQGNLDIPLNETGRNQARQIAARFAGMHWSRIYHSPLSRAAETARIVCAQSPVEMVSVPDLREICMGDWEGMEFAQVKAIMPQEYARYVIDKGSISIDGISLTIANILPNTVLEFWIIPHTWEATNMHTYQPGTVVNIEVDMIAKYVEKMFAGRA